MLPRCYLVDAKFELELVNIVGEGRNATWKSFGVGQKLPIRSPSDNKYMSRMNSADKENIPCESLHRDQIFTSQFIL